MRWRLFFFVVCLIISPKLLLAQIEIDTNPETEDGVITYVSFVEGETNATVECTVINNGVTQVVTDWFIQRESDSMVTQISFSNGIPTNPIDLADELIAIGEPHPTIDGLTYLTNFTIFNFTSQFDGATLQCGSGSNRRSFVLGFPGIIIMIVII